MRIVLTGIIFIRLTILSFGQEPFNWPTDLQTDPNDYTLVQLGIKEIVQYEKYNVEGGFPDSTGSDPDGLNYIITYDSLHRVSSLKYNFLNYWGYSKFFGDSIALDSLRKISVEKKLPVHFLKLNGRWIAKSYWEVIFSYNNYGVSKMEILTPYQRLGTVAILDGVYLKEKMYDEILTKNYYNDFGELIQIDAFSDDVLVWQKFCRYESFERNGYRARLLTRSIVDKSLYILQYSFEE